MFSYDVCVCLYGEFLMVLFDSGVLRVFPDLSHFVVRLRRYVSMVIGFLCM